MNTTDVTRKEARTKQPRKILVKDFQDAAYAYQRNCVTLPPDWPIEECLKPEFWSNVSHLLAYDEVTKRPARIGTIIEVRSQDHAFYAELYVRDVKKQSMKVELIGKPHYFGPADKANDKFEYKWNVGKRKFDVIRKSDREIVAGFTTKEEVFEYIEGMK